MDLEGLQSFLAVARTKSISKAAQYLHVTQPTLSTRIRKIEEGLGFPLLERNWEGVKLTKQGYYFLPYAIQLLQDINNASTVLSNFLGENKTSFEEVTNHANRLQIGIDEWLLPLFIKPILELLRAEYPHLEYKFVTKSTQTIWDLLEYDGLHLGIFYNNESKHNLQTVPLIEDEMVLLHCPNEEFQINASLNNISLLSNEPFILFDNPVLIYHRHITKSIIEKLSIKRFHVVDDYNVMLNLVKTGSGYTIVPKSSVFQYLGDTSFPVTIVPLGSTIPAIKIQLAYVHSTHFNDPIHTMINSLSTYIETVYEKISILK